MIGLSTVLENKKLIRVIIAVAFCLGLLIFSALLCRECLSSERDLRKVANLMKDKDFSSAATILEDLIRKTSDPETKSKYYYLSATCYSKLGQKAKVTSYYQIAAKESHSKFAELARWRLAKSYQSSNNYSSAIEEYTAILREYPESLSAIEAQYQLGECFIAMKQYDSAISHYKRFIESYPNGIRARLSGLKIGYAYQNLSKWQSAYDQYQALIRMNSKDWTARSSLERIRLIISSCPTLIVTRDDSILHGLVLYYARQYKDAREEFKKVINGKDELSARAAYLIADSYYQESAYDTAIKEYESVIKLYPESTYAINSQYQVALCQLKLGRKESARVLLAEFSSSHPDNNLADDAEFQIAETYREDGQCDRAIDAYNRVVEKYPTSELADTSLWNVGWCYIKRRDYNKSAQAFQKLAKDYPGSQLAGSARFWAGMSYEYDGKWQSAISAYKESVQNRDWYYSDRSRKRIELLARQGRIDKDASAFQYNKVEFNESIPALENIKSSNPQWVADLLDFGVFEDVVELFTSAEESGINLEVAYYNLSACYEGMGEFHKSWSYTWRLSQALKLRERNSALPRQLYLRLYPIIHKDTVFRHSQQNNLDPLLVSAVILEESRCDPNAVSRSGACGLMQIIPSTGQDIARRINMKGFKPDMLFQPETNIEMGTWYLNWLMKGFNDEVQKYFAEREGQKPDYPELVSVLTIGAYNGGPTRVRIWIWEYGIEDIDEFVENIPVEETKRYIKKVFDSYEVYKSLYGS